MQIRRVWQADQLAPRPQVRSGAHWSDHTGPWPFDWSVDLPPRQDAPRPASGPALPFQPRSFRDFMLFEQHVIDGSRGYARRFLPWSRHVTRAYEAVLRRPFPAFRPHALWYQQPIYYMSNHLAFVPSGTPVCTPSYTQALDYELELGFVLGRPLFNAAPEEAEAAISHLVVLCDFSARDVQKSEMDSGFGPQKAKHFLSSMSAEAVAAEALDWRARPLQGRVLLDGREVARCSSEGMRYSLGEALAHASRDEQLYPGELFGTGTWPGGSGLENGHWLRPGQLLRLEIDGVGALEHLCMGMVRT